MSNTVTVTLVTNLHCIIRITRTRLWIIYTRCIVLICRYRWRIERFRFERENV